MEWQSPLDHGKGQPEEDRNRKSGQPDPTEGEPRLSRIVSAGTGAHRPLGPTTSPIHIKAVRPNPAVKMPATHLISILVLTEL